MPLGGLKKKDKGAEDNTAEQKVAGGSPANTAKIQTRGIRDQNVKRKDSLMSGQSDMSYQSKYSGKFANGGPKIGFQAFTPAQVPEKHKKK